MAHGSLIRWFYWADRIKPKQVENGRTEPTFDPIVGMERVDSKDERLV